MTRRILATIAITASLCMVSVTPVFAAGSDGNAGNGPSADAEAAGDCNRSGYQELVRKEDGSAFANTGECVSYIIQTGNVCSATTSGTQCIYMIRSRTKHNG